MAEQVVLDEAKFQQVENNAVKVEEDVNQANIHLETGVKSAKGARKKKWMCLGLGVTIVVVIVVIVVVVITLRGGRNTNTTTTIVQTTAAAAPTTAQPAAAAVTTAPPAVRF